MSKEVKKFEFVEIEDIDEANNLNPELWVFVGLKGSNFIFKRRKRKL